MSDELKHLLSEEEADAVTGGSDAQTNSAIGNVYCPYCQTEHSCTCTEIFGVLKHFCRFKNMYFIANT